MSGGTGRNGVRIAESLASSVLRRVPALTDALVNTIHAENPGYRTINVVPHEDLWHSCHDNITRILQLIAQRDRREETPDPDYYDAAHATGRRRAEQRLPLEDVLRSFRLGGRLVWQALTDQARADGAVDTDGLLDVATRVWEIVDATSSQVAAAYHTAERQLVRADEQRRAALWEGLLQGRATDAAFAYEASRIVQLPVDGPYAVVSAGTRNATAETIEALGERLDALKIRSAWQSRADSLVGLLSLPYPALDGAMNVLRESLDAPTGVSLVVSGLAEVEPAFRQATLARRTIPAGQRMILSLSERLPEAFLLSSPDLTEMLVRRWFEPLADLPAHDRRMLVQTLQAWVVVAGSATRAAEALYCHRNTVLNRIRRIEAITGCPLVGAEIPVELILVLRALPFLPHDPGA
jgi:hypothetical protein